MKQATSFPHTRFIGFDQLSDLIDRFAGENSPNYPPYNIEKIDENSFQITMAVAGFTENEIEVEVEGDTLTISGQAETEEETRNFLHKGIAKRAFTRKFNLAPNVKVLDAELKNGILTVNTKREIPEAEKPQRIEIKR